MNRICWMLLLILMAGCDEAPTKPPETPPPKDHIRIEQGPTDADAPTEFTTTESGLKYRILRKSDGKKPADDDTVRVHYRGKLDNGKIFDTSYGRFGGSIVFNLKSVIKGWGEGLQLVGEGGMIELEIPPELGYGMNSPPAIPPNSTLHFVVELIEIRPRNP
jgi:FKBP-type peptidyl-prolyl cis-trans isomerase FkpA/FKBP-type peptidyl-prolyl cis-trans isomerase FklB